MKACPASDFVPDYVMTRSCRCSELSASCQADMVLSEQTGKSNPPGGTAVGGALACRNRRRGG